MLHLVESVYDKWVLLERQKSIYSNKPGMQDLYKNGANNQVIRC